MAKTRDTTSTRALYGKHEDRYLELVKRFPLRPLGSAADLDAAVNVLDSLLDRAELTAPESDYLEVLGDLVEAYEADAVPMRPVSDADALRFLIEHKGASQSDVAEATGIAESTISEVLAGKRKLNRAHIGKLARFFNVGPGAFAFGE
jgi:HTH-type transcriptional regulator/antitoxin HigA